MTTKKQKIKNRWISIGLFFFFSLVLLINNITDLFVKIGIKIPIQWTGWISLVLVLIYTLWMASEDKI